MSMTNVQFSVDDEFKSLIPPLSATERDTLQQNIISASRAFDSLKIWNGILLDGHNRYEICQKHGLPFTVDEIECDPPILSRLDAKEWILLNQFGRRNLDTYTRCEQALLLEEVYREKARANQALAVAAANRARAENPYCQISDNMDDATQSADFPLFHNEDDECLPEDDIANALAGRWDPNSGSDVPIEAAPAKPIALNSATPRPAIVPIDTKKEIAKKANVSHDTIAKAKVIQAKADDATKLRLKAGQTTINKEYKAIVQADREKEKTERNVAAVASMPARTDRYQVFKASVAEIPIEDESVDVIITDPPYPEEFLSVYEELSATAQRVLKPGGSCFVMIGQSYLPQIIQSLGRHLNYQWTLAYLTPGGQATQLWQRKVNTFWKPVLWYVKGDYKGEWLGDVAQSRVNDNDKRHHHWGQSESGMADLILRCSEPGHVILDPFVGGGTTGVVALDLDRRFVGSDIDQKFVDKTIERLGGLNVSLVA